MNFATLIKQKRASLGLTLQEVADAAGIGKGHVHELEAGRHTNPGLLTCTRLAVALGLSVQAMAAAILESNLANKENQQ